MTAASKDTPEKREIFLEHLAATGNVSESAEVSGYGRRAWYSLKDSDPEFSVAWDEALKQATDALIIEGRRRALEGVEEPVFYQGEVCGYVRRYSDTLLMFLVKAHRPEYATERKQLTGADGSPLIPATPSLTDKERAILATVASQLLQAECDDAETD